MEWPEVIDSVENSRKLLEALWRMDSDTVAKGIDKSASGKLHLDKPATIIELKWNKNASGAIAQIKRQQYSEVLKRLSWGFVLAGINYDKKTKLHECVIEKFQKY